jgi:hypothetical protein
MIDSEPPGAISAYPIQWRTKIMRSNCLQLFFTVFFLIGVNFAHADNEIQVSQNEPKVDVGQDPKMTFAEAKQYCRSKGKGWYLSDLDWMDRLAEFKKLEAKMYWTDSLVQVPDGRWCKVVMSGVKGEGYKFRAYVCGGDKDEYTAVYAVRCYENHAND